MFPVVARKKSQVKAEGKEKEKEVKGKIAHPFNTSLRIYVKLLD